MIAPAGNQYLFNRNLMMKAKAIWLYMLLFGGLSVTFIIAAMIDPNAGKGLNGLTHKNRHSQRDINPLMLKYATGIRSIFADSKGDIWFGSHQEGLALLHKGKFQYFNKTNGLSDHQVRNIYEDKNGVVWFECGKGLSRYKDGKMAAYIQKDYHKKNDWKLNKNSIWFKGNEMEAYNQLEGSPGVYEYDGKNLSYRTFPIRSKVGHENHFSISTAFVKGKNGRLWFGSYGAVLGYDGNNFKTLNDSTLGLSGKTGHLHARAIMEDRKGNLWMGNNGIGVLRYDGNKVVNFTVEQKLRKADTGGNSLEKVFALAEDQAGNIWFGTVGSGVWRYDGKLMKNFTKADGLESQHVWTIYKTPQGELWFGGANPSGVYQLTGDRFERKF